MRLIVLSNFAGDKADDLRQQRNKRLEEEIAARKKYLDELRSARDLARRKTKEALFGLDLIGAWRSWNDIQRIKRQIIQFLAAPVVFDVPSIDEQQAKAGNEAEQRLDVFLGEALGEKWTLIAGYSGRNGEIDRILIGPWGVFAFEIKGNRGVIHSDGARWWVERFGRRGNPLGTKTLPRAPDAQLAKTAGWLEGRLHRNGIDLRVGRVILFPADDARIGVIHAANADLVTTLRELDLGSLFDPGSKRSALAPAVCERIVNLVERDHAFWEQTRSGMPDAGRKAKRDRLSQPSFAGL